MGRKRKQFPILNAVLKPLNMKVFKRSRLPESLQEAERYRNPSFRETPLPEGAAEVLKPDHERLVELRERYGKIDSPVTRHSYWAGRTAEGEDLHLGYFRGDNPYVHQYRGLEGSAELKYLLYAYYVARTDGLGLLERLEEDGLFGAYTFDFNGRPVSRDLLDSINELNFLERQLGLSKLESPSILDIGAGYGRLAHRALEALPNLKAYYCTDAIPESTFLSEYYVRFRNVQDRAVVVPLDEIDKTLEGVRPGVAVNIHSFSECTLAAIEWWLDLLARLDVPNLLIVPNTGEALLSREQDKSTLDFTPALEKRGYRLKVKEPKLQDPSLQARLFGTPTFYFLFERGG